MTSKKLINTTRANYQLFLILVIKYCCRDKRSCRHVSYLRVSCQSKFCMRVAPP
ncbi:unnamed protein product [Amoebophrya sp. A120]|nr:unnamed protein product [Amoebophrya sp. A120]|eukprot:GSA120T00025910001.1